MAGDWIKMRCNLSSHPKVVRIASRLSVTRVTVVGALHAVWTVADQHASENGVLDMDADALDLFAEIPGFCQEMEAVGWLEILSDSVKFPEYHEHNGTTGKTRAGNQKRKSKSRETVTNVTKKCDTTVTREEKRREEKRRRIDHLCSWNGRTVIDTHLKDWCIETFTRPSDGSQPLVTAKYLSQNPATRELLLKIGVLRLCGVLSEALVVDGCEALRHASKPPANAGGYLRTVWSRSKYAPDGAEPGWLDEMLGEVELPEGI